MIINPDELAALVAIYLLAFPKVVDRTPMQSNSLTNLQEAELVHWCVQDGDKFLSLTAKGHAYLDHLCNQELPVRQEKLIVSWNRPD